MSSSISNTALASELNTDPAALGYAAFIASKDAVSLAALLNFVRNGTTACPVNNVVGAAITVNRNDVAPKEIVNCIATADFNAATQIQISKLEMLFVAGVVDCTLANVSGNLQSIFSGASTATKNALTAVVTRNGSRAEQLATTGYSVTDSQIRQALGW